MHQSRYSITANCNKGRDESRIKSGVCVPNSQLNEIKYAQLLEANVCEFDTSVCTQTTWSLKGCATSARQIMKTQVSLLRSLIYTRALRAYSLRAHCNLIGLGASLERGIPLNSLPRSIEQRFQHARARIHTQTDVLAYRVDMTIFPWLGRRRLREEVLMYI